ncbi:MAG TPA: HAMP domain-containing sensor histidine kinase [Planctomycetaceae bacterium]|nr:HAMP domain-containing sensor histidine kinase [Planctomycetaceae bacterium]
MKFRSLTLIVLIVLLPTGLLTWFAVRMARDDASMTEQRFRSLMEQRLQDVNQLITRQFSDTERRLQQITSIDEFDTAKLRERVRTTPQVTQVFVLAPGGDLVYPDPTGPLNGTEQSFLRQASRMFTDRDLQNAVALAAAALNSGDFTPSLLRSNLESSKGAAAPQLESQVATESERSGVLDEVAAQTDVEPGLKPQLPASDGWFVWYWDRGLNLVYWQRRPTGHIVGAALERSRWIADVIAVLPETMETGTAADRLNNSCRVVNAASETVYDWGLEIEENAVPFCEIPVAAPLASWRLQCFVPESQMLAGSGRSAIISLTTGLSAFTLTLVVLAWLLYRDYSRDIREATQQVSFVNQVSHELKTPLTNIRMYAELLGRDLDEADQEYAARPRARLDVITSEAQRLSRLIGNVLTFARQKRKTLEPRPRDTNVSDLVHQIVDRFGPSLSEHGIVATVEASTGQTLSVDPDFVEQILGNLINNVEKYAASGKQLIVRCGVTASRATINVIDAGPGIPVEHRASVFLPFTRLSNDVRASTGTGIGLSIARDLARLHRGDVTLMDAPQGCWFRVELGSINPNLNRH